MVAAASANVIQPITVHLVLCEHTQEVFNKFKTFYLSLIGLKPLKPLALERSCNQKNYNGIELYPKLLIYSLTKS